MEGHVVEWLNLLGRWVHMVTGIAWIGASFYFVWLDNHLRPPGDQAASARGVGGEVWSVHGGGFYHAQKYRVAPPVLPEPLHWFKWEAYATWLSGMFLLALLYWHSAALYLIDPAVAELTPWQAVGLSAGSIVVGWLVYDGLCRSPLGRDERLLGIAVLVASVLAAWGLGQIFSGRGAFLQFGAILGTIMVANVFFVIIPGQRELVAAKHEGREPDAGPGLRGKQRSVHNTYFTLPVLLTMTSNHFASVHGHPHAWLVLAVLSVAGAAARVYFVARHKGPPSPLPAVLAVVLVLGVVVALAPGGDAAPGAGAAPAFDQVRAIVERRCAGCHAARPTQAGFVAAPKGVSLESDDQIAALAAQIHLQAVTTRAMPPGNLTGMTAEERASLGAWFAAGGATD